MISSKFLGCAAGLVFAALANGSWAADSTRPAPDATRAQTGKVTPAPRPAATKSGTARGVLPDPVLLDGSTLPPEKKSEHGMIGDFELPGDENAKSGRVGGPQNPGQQQGQQGQNGAGSMPMGLPQGGGASGQQAQQQAGKAGAAGQQGAEPPPGQQGAAGQPIQGAGDPNAKAEGVQVAQLGGEGAGDQQQGAPGEKPPPVAIGDSAMRIQTPANTPGVVGAQQLPSTNTQQHDKGTGSGGKGPTGSQGANRVEKGRTIPAGL
jgi:hypothetical protein